MQRADKCNKMQISVHKRFVQKQKINTEKKEDGHFQELLYVWQISYTQEHTLYMTNKLRPFAFTPVQSM